MTVDAQPRLDACLRSSPYAVSLGVAVTSVGDGVSPDGRNRETLAPESRRLPTENAERPMRMPPCDRLVFAPLALGLT
jgi:hypothetical protein